MCGVSGIVSPSLSPEELDARVRRMGCVQSHRGPDDSASMVALMPCRRVALGFVRLSILDLETGMQPIEAEDCTIACNGQIYNYLELRQELDNRDFTTTGDIEVALHLYRKMGTDFLQRLNGMYAGAILDRGRRRLILFRDRFGIKPLYYMSTGDGFFFSSEIRPLYEGSGTGPAMDPESLPVFLSYRYVPGSRTMFRGVRRLPPASLLEMDLDSGEWSIHRYWEYLPGSTIRNIRPKEAREEFLRILKDAVRIRMRSDVEVGSLLSGGVDSSSVASLAASAQPEIKLFTVSFQESAYNELDEVRSLVSSMGHIFGRAEMIHAPCTRDSLARLPELVESVEDCISLGTVLPTDQVCRLASSYLKVVLTGEGADEIFAGYRKFLLESAAEEMGSASPEMKERLLSEYPELEKYMNVRARNPERRFIQSELLFHHRELSRLIGRKVEEVVFPSDAMPAVNSIADPLNQLLAMECRSRLPDYVVLRLDKLSMRHSLETRTPYLDYRLAQFAASLPVAMKVNLARGMGKYICRSSLESHGVVDAATARRTKKPFTIPMAAWLLRSSSLPDFAREILGGESPELDGLLDQDMVRSIWSDVTARGVLPDTLVSEADRAFALLTLGLWRRAFKT